MTRLTNYRDYDVKYPGFGAGKVVYQYRGGLHVLDLATGADREVVIDVATDRAPMRSELVDVAPATGSFGLSPAGERLLLEARGEILNLPAEKGEWFDLTRTSASREKNAAWSPDGRWVCFVSDRTGEEQLYVADQRGRDAWRSLTPDNKGFLLQPVWSPDSKRILWGDKFMRLNMVDVASGKITVLDQGEWDDAWERWGILDYVWSPDSQWVAYSKNTENMHEVICLYSLASGKVTQVTDNFFTSWSPSFDPEGRYLWFLSNRTFNPIMDRQDQNHIFMDLAKPYLVLLQDGVRSPFFEDPGLVEAKAAEAKADDKKKDEKKDKADDEAAATRIDLAGLGERVLAADGVESGNYFRLTATADGCLLLRRDEPIFTKYQNVDDRTGDSDLALVSYDLEEKEAKDLAERPRQLPPLGRRQEAGLPRRHAATAWSTRTRSSRPATARWTSTACASASNARRSTARCSTRPGASSATGSTTRTCTASTGRRSTTSTPPWCPGAARAATSRS